MIDPQIKFIRHFDTGGDVKKSHEELAHEFLSKLTPDDFSELREAMVKAKNAVVIKEQKKLDDLISEKSVIDTKRTNGRNTLETEARMNLADESRKLELLVISQENTVLAFKNGGDSISFDDKKGVTHKGIPYFSKINTDIISFDEETILVDIIPPYIPRINEEVFRAKGYIFDVIRISKDEYLLSVNGYKEKNASSYNSRFEKQDESKHPSDQEQGYVIVTLDQLALINDYYFIKAKALLQKEAAERNERTEKYYDTLPESKRASYLMKPGYYRALPAAVKKKNN